jgi:6-phosphofructokinase 1
MGRDAGWLTAASALPRISGGVGPDLIYLPEKPFSKEAFLRDVNLALERHPAVLVAVSEGIRFADGHYVGEGTQSGATDAFGHAYLAGTGKALELAIKAEIGCKVRSIELNLPQRCAAHIASETDLSESVGVGRYAVQSALNGVSGEMMCMTRVSTEPYEIVYEHKDVLEIANRIRYVDDAFINADANHVTDACCAYLLPLIRGEADVAYENGLPKHITL